MSPRRAGSRSISIFIPRFDEVVVVREGEAERLGMGDVAATLLADGSATGNALSVVRATMGKRSDGARPHTHSRGAEVFYMLDGALQVLTGEKVVQAARGDLIVVPPDTVHAFATPSSSGAEFLIMLTPSGDRFDYFRLLARVARGEATVEDVLKTQEQYDNHFVDSPQWREALEARA